MSRAIHLKVKVKTLAAEARIIRKEERKALKAGRYWKYADAPRDPHKSGRAMQDAYRTYESLHEHRTGIVRSAARINNLAYGFLIGLSYEEMERYAKTEPHWNGIEKLVKRFGSKEDQERWNSWLAGAQVHFSGKNQKEVA
jgi:hypothetical protein